MNNSKQTPEKTNKPNLTDTMENYTNQRDKSTSSTKGKTRRSKSKNQLTKPEISLAEATTLELLRQISLEDVMLLMTPRLVLADWVRQINQTLQQKFELQQRLNELYDRRAEILQIDELKQAKISPAIPTTNGTTIKNIAPITDFLAANTPSTSKAKEIDNSPSTDAAQPVA